MKTILTILAGLFILSKLEQGGLTLNVSAGKSFMEPHPDQAPYGGAAAVITPMMDPFFSGDGGSGGAGPAAPGSAPSAPSGTRSSSTTPTITSTLGLVRTGLHIA
jgi:hypothetical protein